MRKNILALTSYLERTSTNETTIRVVVNYLNAWLQQLATLKIQEIAPNASRFLIKAIEEQSQ
jgi:hypothetical protein